MSHTACIKNNLVEDGIVTCYPGNIVLDKNELTLITVESSETLRIHVQASSLTTKVKLETQPRNITKFKSKKGSNIEWELDFIGVTEENPSVIVGQDEPRRNIINALLTTGICMGIAFLKKNRKFGQ